MPKNNPDKEFIDSEILASSQQQQQQPTLADEITNAIISSNFSRFKELLPSELPFIIPPVLDADELLTIASRSTDTRFEDHIRELKTISDRIIQGNLGQEPTRAKRSRTSPVFFTEDSSASSSSSAAASTVSPIDRKRPRTRAVARPDKMLIAFDFSHQPQTQVSGFDELGQQISSLNDLFTNENWKNVIEQGLIILHSLINLPQLDEEAANQYRYLAAALTAILASAIINQQYSHGVKINFNIESGNTLLTELGFDFELLDDFKLEKNSAELLFKQENGLKIALIFALISNNLSNNLTLREANLSLYKPFANLDTAAGYCVFNLSSIVAYMDSEIAEVAAVENLDGWREMARIYSTLANYNLDMRSAAMLIKDKETANAAYAESLSNLINVLDYTVKTAEACRGDEGLKQQGLEHLIQAYAALSNLTRFIEVSEVDVLISDNDLLAYFDRMHVCVPHFLTQNSDKSLQLRRLDQISSHQFRPSVRVSSGSIFSRASTVREELKAADAMVQLGESPVMLKR